MRDFMSGPLCNFTTPRVAREQTATDGESELHASLSANYNHSVMHSKGLDAIQ